jgi:hypothetical protein
MRSSDIVMSSVRPSPISQPLSSGTLSLRNFMQMIKKLMDLNFEPLRFMGSMATIWPKSQFSDIGHDGALPIRNFVLNKA